MAYRYYFRCKPFVRCSLRSKHEFGTSSRNYGRHWRRKHAQTVESAEREPNRLQSGTFCERSNYCYTSYTMSTLFLRCRSWSTVSKLSELARERKGSVPNDWRAEKKTRASSYLRRKWTEEEFRHSGQNTSDLPCDLPYTASRQDNPAARPRA